MSNGTNILLPSLSNRKCTGLSLLNRVPEAELEIKLSELRRDHARFKLNARLTEVRLWDELYRNSRELKTSFVSKYSFEEAMANKHEFQLPHEARTLDANHKHKLPFAEEYKEFIIFRAKTMLEMYGPKGSKYFDRPNYKALYAKNANLKSKNSRSMDKIRTQYEGKFIEDKKILSVLNSDQETNNKTEGRQSNNRAGRHSRNHSNGVYSCPSNSLTPPHCNSLTPPHSNAMPRNSVSRRSHSRDGSANRRCNTMEQIYTLDNSATYALKKMPTITVNPTRIKNN